MSGLCGLFVEMIAFAIKIINTEECLNITIQELTKNNTGHSNKHFRKQLIVAKSVFDVILLIMEGGGKRALGTL